MNIDFTQMTFDSFPAFKGGEKELLAKMSFDGKNRIMRARLVPGASIGMHRHEGNCEMIYILSGSGSVIFDGEKSPVCQGMCHYCPEGHTHSLVNDSDLDLDFFAVVPEQ